MSHIIELSNLTKKYRGNIAVNNISLKINPGIHAFLGPNGAGKSTTILLLTFLIKKSQGNIKFNERNFSFIGEKSFFYNKLGFLPENSGFYPNLTGIDNLKLFFSLKGINKNVKQEAVELLNLVKIPEKFWMKKTRTYSHGMRQRLAIARAFIGDPSILILDEPFQNLDPIGRDELIQLILAKRKKDTIILFTTHETYEAEQLASDITIFNQGEILISENMNQLAVLNNFNDFMVVPPINNIDFNSWVNKINILLENNNEDLLSPIKNAQDHIFLQTKYPEKLDIFLRNNDINFTLRPVSGTLGKIYRKIIGESMK